MVSVMSEVIHHFGREHSPLWVQGLLCTTDIAVGAYQRGDNYALKRVHMRSVFLGTYTKSLAYMYSVCTLINHSGRPGMGPASKDSSLKDC